MVSQHKDIENATTECSASLPRIWRVRALNIGWAQRYPGIPQPFQVNSMMLAVTDFFLHAL